jgi:hypothetical protein
VSVEFTCVVPEMVGACVFAGADALETTAVGAEVALMEPSAFFAVTVARSVWPTSADCAVYVFAVAPPIAVQLSPFLSQLLHAYAKLVGLPVHVPSEAVSVDPSCGVPETVGVPVLLGAACAAARPARGPPSNAPTASAASAMTTAAGQRRLVTDIVVTPFSPGDSVRVYPSPVNRTSGRRKEDGLAGAGPRRKLCRMKGADKQKKLVKKAPQKTLKERRAEKRAAEKNRGV